MSSVNRRRQSQCYHFWLGFALTTAYQDSWRRHNCARSMQSSPRNPTLPAGSCALLGWLGTVLVWQWAGKGLYSRENAAIISSLFGSCCTSWLEKLEFWQFWRCGNCIWIFRFASFPHAWGWSGFEPVLLCEARSFIFQWYLSYRLE